MKVFLFLICILFSSMLSAQSFFNLLPKLKKQNIANRPALVAIVPPGDITYWAFRPIACAATIFVGGTVEAAAGVGGSYQNITQRASDGRNYVNYAFSGLVLAGGSVVPDKPTDIQKFGLMVSALNNTVGGGPAASRLEYRDPVTDVITKKWKIGLMVVWAYNFNN